MTEVEMQRLIIDKEDEGDNIYHLHRKDCPYAPKSNYQRVEEIEYITNLEKKTYLLSKVNIKGCTKCLDDNERKQVEENIKILFLK